MGHPMRHKRTRWGFLVYLDNNYITWGIRCRQNLHFYLWTLPKRPAFPVKIGLSEMRTESIKIGCNCLQYSMLAEFSARKTYLWDYQHWILWTKDQNGDKDFNNLFFDDVSVVEFSFEKPSFSAEVFLSFISVGLKVSALIFSKYHDSFLIEQFYSKCLFSFSLFLFIISMTIFSIPNSIPIMMERQTYF